MRRLVRHAVGAGAHAPGQRRQRLAPRRSDTARARSGGTGVAGRSEGAGIAARWRARAAAGQQPVRPASGRRGPTGTASTGPLVVAETRFIVCPVHERFSFFGRSFSTRCRKVFQNDASGIPRRSVAIGVDPTCEYTRGMQKTATLEQHMDVQSAIHARDCAHASTQPHRDSERGWLSGFTYILGYASNGSSPEL